MTKMDLMLVRMIKNSKVSFSLLIITITGICVYTSMSMASANLSDTLDTYYEERPIPSSVCSSFRCTCTGGRDWNELRA